LAAVVLGYAAQAPRQVRREVGLRALQSRPEGACDRSRGVAVSGGDECPFLVRVEGSGWQEGGGWIKGDMPGGSEWADCGRAEPAPPRGRAKVRSPSGDMPG